MVCLTICICFLQQLSSNGYLTFDGSSPVEPPNSAHSNTDIIAPFWTKFDNSEHKTISYQQITNGSLLQQATSDIQDNFPDLTFSATWIFIANWVFKTESVSKVLFKVIMHWSTTSMKDTAITMLKDTLKIKSNYRQQGDVRVWFWMSSISLQRKQANAAIAFLVHIYW